MTEPRLDDRDPPARRSPAELLVEGAVALP
jgi:hypothetical protein